jgi:hypothetical protein
MKRRRTKEAHLSAIDGSNYGWGAGVSPPPPPPPLAIASLEYSSERKKEGVQWCYCCLERKRGESGGRRSGEAWHHMT